MSEWTRPPINGAGRKDQVGNEVANQTDPVRRLLRVRSAAFALAVIVTAVLVGILFGHLAAHKNDPFDWNVASAAATAFATIALAGGTFVLAFTALEDAGASSRLASLARDDQWARDRPTIVILDYELQPAVPSVGREVPTAKILYANVGLAPAINVTFGLIAFDSNNDPVVMSQELRTRQLTWPNERGDIEGVLLVRGDFADRERTEITVNAIDRRGRPSTARWVADRDGDFYLGSSEFDRHPRLED